MMSRIRDFRRDARGSIAIAFAIAVIPATIAVGMTVDYVRAVNARTRLQQATDAAVIAAGRAAITDNPSDARAYAENFVKAASGFDARVRNFVISAGRTKICMDTTVDIARGLSQIGAFMDGGPVIPVSAAACTEFNDATFEIALVMDNSGSMASAATGGKSRLQAAKDAATQLVNLLMDSASMAGRVHFSVVPFNLSVKVGSQYARSAWTDTQGVSPIHWQQFDRDASVWKPQSRFDLFTELNVAFGGCFETRPGAWGLNDAPPTPGVPESYFVPHFAPDEPGDRGDTTYRFSTGGWSTQTYSYPNSYLDDFRSSTCSAADENSASDVGKAQKKLCKYRSRPSISTSGGRGPNYNCTGQSLMRLSQSKSTIVSAIDGMTANGNTNLMEGFAWGWRTLSPNAPFADGRSYVPDPSKPFNNKIVILLTDGRNVWNSANNHNDSIYAPMGFYGDDRLRGNIGSGSGIGNGGQATAALDAATQRACDNAKAQGVIVYTIGFASRTSDVNETLLRNCATRNGDGKVNYYFASDSAKLMEIFEDIANSIGRLRLTT